MIYAYSTICRKSVCMKGKKKKSQIIISTQNNFQFDENYDPDYSVKLELPIFFCFSEFFSVPSMPGRLSILIVLFFFINYYIHTN